MDAAAIVDRLRTELGSSLSPQLMGVNLYPARAAALEGARGATDFGEYFSYFSFFLVVAALLLTVLFFKLGVEQRLRQIGILRAAGFTIAAIRRLLVSEALVVAFLGAVVGIAGAVLYGRLIVYGLRTWWVGAVGTTLIAVHVNPLTVTLGAIGGVLAAVLCVVVSLRAIGRVSPRSLLTMASLENEVSADPRRARRRRLWAMLWALTGGALLVLGFLSQKAQAGAFFGAGASLLVSALLLLAAWLRARNARVLTGSGLLAGRPPGFPQHGASAGADRALGRADRLCSVHHRVRRGFPARRHRLRRRSAFRHGWLCAARPIGAAAPAGSERSWPGARR